jgi:hypothetical protein
VVPKSAQKQANVKLFPFVLCLESLHACASSRLRSVYAMLLLLFVLVSTHHLFMRKLHVVPWHYANIMAFTLRVVSSHRPRFIGSSSSSMIVSLSGCFCRRHTSCSFQSRLGANSRQLLSPLTSLPLCVVASRTAPFLSACTVVAAARSC